MGLVRQDSDVSNVLGKIEFELQHADMGELRCSHCNQVMRKPKIHSRRIDTVNQKATFEICSVWKTPEFNVVQTRDGKQYCNLACAKKYMVRVLQYSVCCVCGDLPKVNNIKRIGNTEVSETICDTCSNHVCQDCVKGECTAYNYKKKKLEKI